MSWAVKKRDRKLQLQALWVLDSGLHALERGEMLPCFTQFDFFECLVRILAPESKSSQESKEFATNIIERFLVVLDKEISSDRNTAKKIENYLSTIDVIYRFVMEFSRNEDYYCLSEIKL